MNAFPDNFPLETLSETDTQKVSWFCQRFTKDFNDEYGFGHFLLAAYASVPALLTPDLLYKIWQNFNGYKWAGESMSIHRIAVADILLSSLCREVGYELYEMHYGIRLAFLEWLNLEVKTPKWQNRQLKKIENIAFFVEQYHQAPSLASHRWGEKFLASQSLEALSYLDPAGAAQKLFHQLTVSTSDTDTLRIMDSIIKTRQRLERLDMKEFIDIELLKRQTELMHAWISLIQQNNNDVLEQLNRQPGLLDLLTEFNDGGIKVTVDDKVVRKIDLIAKRSLKVMVIASSEDDIVNASLMAVTMQNSYLSRYLDLVELKPEQFSAKVLTQQWQQFIAGLSWNSNVAVYFSAVNIVDINGSGGLRCSDGSLLNSSEVKNIFTGANCASVTIFFEAGANKINPADWFSLTDTANIVFSSSGDGIKTLEGHNIFTAALTETITNDDLLETNRNFFIRFLSACKKKLHKINATATRGWNMNLPSLYANTQSYANLLVDAFNENASFETMLRRNGYYHGRSKGDWNDEANKAFEEYRNEFADDPDFVNAQEKSDFISLLENIYNKHRTEAVPIFVLVFCDPEKRLASLPEERAQILALTRPGNNELSIEVIVLDDPGRAELEAVLKDKKNRNRIELFYFSGNDEDGNILLADGPFTPADFAWLLDYQENINFFIANTCRSAGFGPLLTNTGVRCVVAAEAVIDDKYGKEMGINLFEHIRNRSAIGNVRHLQNSFSGIFASGAFNQFNVYKAAFSDIIPAWPSRWFDKKSNPANDGARIFSVVIGVSHSPLFNKQELSYCADNAANFGNFLEDYSKSSDRQVIQNASSEGYISRKQALDALRLFEDAKEGDCCVFFYSGAAIVDQADPGDILDFVFSDDTAESATSNSLLSMFDELFAYIKNKNLAVFVISDLHGKIIVSRQPALSRPSAELGSSVLFENSSIEDLSKTRSDTSSANDQNGFMNTLLEVLHTEGVNCTYRNFFDTVHAKLKNRTSIAPIFTANPGEAADYLMFSVEGQSGFPGDKNQQNKKKQTFDGAEENKSDDKVLLAIHQAAATKELDLSGCGLTGFPSGIFEINDLRVLNVSHNEINNIPEAIEHLGQLEELNLSFNSQLKWLPDKIGDLTALTLLDISNTNIEVLPDSMRKLQNLKKIRMQHSLVKVFDPAIFLLLPFEDFDSSILNPLNFRPGNSDYMVAKKDMLDAFESNVAADYSIIEINSDNDTPRFNSVPENVRAQVHYAFHSGVNTLPQLFKIICNERSVKHTIIYIRDTNNLLAPQFGEGMEKQKWVYNYFRAFHAPLNIIIDSPAFESHAFADLVGSGELNFVAIGKDPSESNPGFMRLYLDGLWSFDKAQEDPNASRVRLSTVLKNIHPQIQYLYTIYQNDSLMKDFSLPVPESTFEMPVQEHGEDDKPPADSILFKDKWVLVVGTGNEKISKTEQRVCAALGTLLAGNGYGLISGGWPGVDEAVYRAFINQLKAINRLEEQAVLEVVTGSQEPQFRADNIETVRNDSAWYDYTIAKAFAVIVVGGKGGSYKTFTKARQVNVPVIPLRATGGDAGEVFKEIVAFKQYNYPTEELLAFPGEFRTDQDIIDAMYRIKVLLERCESITKEADDFTARVKKLYSERKIVESGDLQKERWGGSNVNNGKQMTATVTAATVPNYFTVTISVTTVKNGMNGQAAFFLHDSYKEQIVYATFENNIARISVEAYEAFTVGAYLEDGTMLELDLNRQTGYPKDFYYDYIGEKFKTQVEQLYKNKRITVKDDLQKNRWGGKKTANGKSLTADVTEIGDSKDFRLSVEVSSDNTIMLPPGDVAFFLHNTFDREIWYKKVVNGVAGITLIAHEAFTIGAYTDDGTELELDLQQQEDYPDDFYYDDTSTSKENFYTKQEIIDFVKKSRGTDFQDGGEQALLFFKTSKQHTWLVTTHLYSYILLDDANTRAQNRLIQTSFPVAETLPLNTKPSSNKKGVTVQFGAQETWWYYSRNLFATATQLIEEVSKIIPVPQP